MKKVILSFIFLFIFSASGAFAQISISDIIVDYRFKDKKYKDVTVKNNGKEEAFVEVAVFELKNPGMFNEKKVRVSKKKADKLVVSPSKFVIPAGGSKLLRFIALDKNLKQDSIYYVQVVPKVGEVKADVTTIKVVVGYEILVINRPDEAKYSVIAKRDGNKVSFTNKGNTNVALLIDDQCNEDGIKCKSIENTRLYPGNVFDVTLPYKDAPIVYKYNIGDDIIKEKI